MRNATQREGISERYHSAVALYDAMPIMTIENRLIEYESQTVHGRWPARDQQSHMTDSNHIYTYSHADYANRQGVAWPMISTALSRPRMILDPTRTASFHTWSSKPTSRLHKNLHTMFGRMTMDNAWRTDQGHEVPIMIRVISP